MRRVMIVDDEFLVRVGIKSFVDWEKHGYTIIGEAADGIEALEKIEALNPDVVLTDLKMEGMDGFDLIEKSRNQFPWVKFIVLSSFDDVINVKRAMKLGAVDYIFKLTSKPEELLDILNSISWERPENEMARLVRKNMPAIKARLIQLAMQKQRPRELQQEFQEVGLSTDFSKNYCVMYFSYRLEKDTVMDNGIMKFALENMIQEVLSEHFCSETYAHTGETLLAVLNAEGLDEKKLTELGQDVFGRIYEYVHMYLGITIEGAMSPVSRGLDAFRESVACCKKALDHCRTRPSGQLRFFEGDMRPEIQSVRQYVSEHIAEDFTVKTAARMCNMSESYFSHLFKKETGVSFVDYVNQQKVRQAEKLLAETELRISEIAAAVGVENPNYFSVLFKRVRGESPQEYRNRIRGGRKAESK